MPAADVTVVVVPRERFSCSVRALTRLYEVTDEPFDLVYVDAKSPRSVRDQLRAAAVRHRFTLLRAERYLSPNQARNLALRRVRTSYVALIDNDLLVTPGWLGTLLRCAEETGAWAVGPLYFEGDPANEVIHMAGGDIELSGEFGARRIVTTHRLQHVRFADAPPLQREPCDYVEFHCVLLRTDAFDRLGPLDERLLASREHLDLCLRIAGAGGTVWVEPAARVTYLTPPPVPVTDIPYYWLRWSEAWSTASLTHFCDLYGIDPTYVERLSIMRHRRQAVFAPLLASTRRRLGTKAEHAVGRVLRRTEPWLNRALVRHIPSTRHADSSSGSPVRTRPTS